jgi:long-chain acyl-CoA synthetase
VEKIWLKNYPQGVPSEIDPDRYHSLNELLEEACDRYAGHAAFSNMNTAITYQVLEEKSRAFATYCLEVLKLKKGDRVALMMPNLLQYPIAMFGVLRAGLVVVNINPLYTARELAYELEDAECETIVILSNVAHTLAEILNKTHIRNIIVTEIGDLFPPLKAYSVNWVVKYVKRMVPEWAFLQYTKFKDVLKIGQTFVFNKPLVAGNDTAFLQYTGGTTGLAKGAMLSHRNLVANIEQAVAWISPQVEEGMEVVVTALPLYHIFSLTANCFTFMRIGALNILVTNPRDIDSFVKLLRRSHFTALTAVNTLFKALLNNPQFATIDFSQLRITLGGGMVVQQTVSVRWKSVTKTPLIAAYGLTEASPAVCINPLNGQHVSGTIGLPVSSTEISIRTPGGSELGVNTPGELWVKGPQVMQGYWKRPTETELVLQDGWLKTGDIATIDAAGFVRIVDRQKDMILVSGFNVYPNEVEEVISRMQGVSEVAVIGVSRENGENVKAFVVKRNLNLTKEEIVAHCHRELTPYKVPKEIEFRNELPKSNVGKILRRLLKEEEQKD